MVPATLVIGGFAMSEGPRLPHAERSISPADDHFAVEMRSFELEVWMFTDAVSGHSPSRFLGAAWMVFAGNVRAQRQD